MAKYFSKTVDRYLLNWIRKDTWHTCHPYDMERFYQFVKALRRYSRKPWLHRVRENIVNAARNEHPELGTSFLDKMAGRFSSLVQEVFDYASAPFPDPLVEMKHPHEIASKLRSREKVGENGCPHRLYTEEEIDEFLAKKFGQDWKGPYWKGPSRSSPCR